MTTDGPSPNRRDERVVSACFATTFLAAVGLAIVYWRGGQPQAEGVLLGIAGAGIAGGMVTWAHRLLPIGPFVEDRESVGSRAIDREAVGRDLDRGGVITRRRLITRTLGAGVAALGAALLFPLRSLGPRPTDAELDSTPWSSGRRLVTDDGVPVAATSVPAGGMVTVFPEGAVGSETGQAVLINVSPDVIIPLPGRADWSPQGLIAYSKVCTHAGCPVGLYEHTTNQLLCPCHQSTFDVLNGARPVFGPAAVALPQLPLTIDGDGNVRAGGGFSSPPGPSFWNRRR